MVDWIGLVKSIIGKAGPKFIFKISYQPNLTHLPQPSKNQAKERKEETGK